MKAKEILKNTMLGKGQKVSSVVEQTLAWKSKNMLHMVINLKDYHLKDLLTIKCQQNLFGLTGPIPLTFSTQTFRFSTCFKQSSEYSVLYNAVNISLSFHA